MKLTSASGMKFIKLTAIKSINQAGLQRRDKIKANFIQSAPQSVIDWNAGLNFYNIQAISQSNQSGNWLIDECDWII